MRNHQKTAIIVGSDGQDGTLLHQYLKARNYSIFLINRRHLKKELTTTSFDINCKKSVFELIRNTKPNSIYYLAAHHLSSEIKTEEYSTYEYRMYESTNVSGLLNFLSALRQHSPETHLFYASSSLIFEGSDEKRQTERSPYNPVGFYGITKLQGMLLCKHFRERFGLFASVGILFSHESHLRRSNYLSKKLILAANEISNGRCQILKVGHLEALNDWGYAKEYVDAFYLINNARDPDDYIVATGQAHSVREFSTIVFSQFNLNATEHVIEDESLNHRRTKPRIGDYRKLYDATGWEPKYSFEEMIRTLISDWKDSCHYEVTK